jgi:uncharacterized protein (TIGR02099 family)
MSAVLRHLRRVHLGLGYTAAAVVIGVAILLGLLSQALPLLARHPARVDAWLEHRTGRPIAFDAVRTHWTRSGPLVELKGLRIGEGRDAFLVGDAQLLASIYSGLLPGKSFTELRLRGLDMTLERSRDGRWQVRGLPGQDTADGDAFEVLERLGELHVVGGRLAVVAPDYGIDARIPRVDLRLRVDGTRVRAGLRAWPDGGREPLDGVLDFDRASGDGRAYAGASRTDLAHWSQILNAAGVGIPGGQGELRAWATLDAHRVAAATAQARLTDVTLQGAPLDGQVPRLVFEELDLLGTWRADEGGWQAHMSRLRIRQGSAQQTLDGLATRGGRRFELVARRVDAAPLLQVAALSDRLPPGARRWLRRAQPVGMVEEVRIAQGGGRLGVDARLASLGFGRVGTSPGVRGLAGRLQGDSEGFDIDFDPSSPVHFSWPRAFGPDHVVRLTGRAGVWRDGPGWRVGSHALRIDGAGYAADLRGGLRWQGDGSRPWIDVAADIDPAQVPVARRFWVRHLMPASLVRWLDTALVGGSVTGGRAVIVGDLDQWPFVHGEGRFEARARISGATLKFQPDWPAAEDVDADLVFVGNGFGIDGTGRVGGVAFNRLQARIDDYSRGVLSVDASGRGDAGRLLDVVRASPLRSQQPETVAALSASGPVEVDFGLRLPLGRADPLSIAGEVRLGGTRLADRRWNLQFDDVRGRVRYDREGFVASDMPVRHEGQPGRLSLRAGEGHVRDPANVFEGGVDASFGIDELLARAPEMGWLASHVAGRSSWTVGVAVPKAPASGSAPARLQLRSNLVGTSLDLPEPLRKPAGQGLATFVDTPLPLGSGEIRVDLGQLVDVRARSLAGKTGVRVHLGPGEPEGPVPADGLVATGRAAQLDALDWIAFTRGGTGSGDGLTLQRIDVTAQRLGMLGGQFADTRLQVTPMPQDALMIRADGAALAGSLSVPAGNGGIVGRFGRVHWRPVAGAGGGRAAQPARAASAAISFDPTRLPALSVDIDDLRFGPARLGVARLRTRPTPAGMRLEEFTARGADQTLQASGDWTGRGAATRTRLQASVKSEDFGALLDGFGFGGRLGGGRGTASFDASWPGAPADFRIEAMQGALTLDARDGRLLEVEPGAGRVLGLLSLAELPRRLTLDFRDFFSKGFSFNRLRGRIGLGNGFARSDDLAIRGPAADIDIRGSANLRQQTFDQTVEVRPKSGNLLTAVGALAGGPVGAAIGAAANAVLRKPLGQIGAKTYRVTGPWSDPEVEVMSREQTRIQVAARPAG